MANTKGVAIVYLRRSTGKQEQSLEGQLEWAVGKAEQLGLTLASSVELLRDAIVTNKNRAGDAYLDNAITGADLERPGYLAFRKRALEDPDVTHCLSWARDRFARPELAEVAVASEKRILLAGKHMVVAQGICCDPRIRHDNKTAEDIQILLEYIAAGAFRPDLAKKVLRGQDANAKSGFSNGGRAPYGFVRACLREGSDYPEPIPDGETRRGQGLKVVLVPGQDPESLRRLETVRRIHDLYYGGVAGLNAIASRLNEEGVPSPNAGRARRDPKTRRKRTVPGKWTLSSVRMILEQTLYMGQSAWGRRQQGCMFRYASDVPGGAREVRQDELSESGRGRKTFSRDREDWLTTEPAHPFEPIVEPRIWHANHERLREAAKPGGLRGRPRHRDPNKYPLKVICGDCGHAMCGTPYGGGPAYKCSTYSNSHGAVCNHNWVQRDVMVGFAIRAVQEMAGREGNRETLRAVIQESLLAQQGQAAHAKSDLTRLEGELQVVEDRKRAAYRDMHESLDPERRADAEDYYETLIKRVRGLRRKIAAARRSVSASSMNLEEEVESSLAVLAELHLLLDRVTPDSLREVFDALGVTIRVEFERRKVGQRAHIPVHAELRIGCREGFAVPALPEEAVGAEEALGVGGRGERI